MAETYKELNAQLIELQARTEEARLNELNAIIEQVRGLVSEYGITADQIFGRKRGPKAEKATVAAEAKYRNAKTGETWSGRGRAPAWIRDAKNRERFLIK